MFTHMKCKIFISFRCLFLITFEQQFFLCSQVRAFFFLFGLKRTYHVLLKGWVPTHKKNPLHSLTSVSSYFLDCVQ